MLSTPDSRRELISLAHYRMPFGKYSGTYLTELPLPYLIWFRAKGFPGGILGRHMEAALMIRDNGLEPLIRKIRKEFPRHNS